MKKSTLLLMAALLAAALFLAGCATPAPAEETPPATEEATPAEEPTPAPATQEPAATEAPAEEPTEQPEEPSVSDVSDTDFTTFVGKTPEEITGEFGEADLQQESTVDDTPILAYYYRSETFWFQQDDSGSYSLFGVTNWRPAAPATIAGVKVAMDIGEAKALLEADGYEYIDGEPLEDINEIFSVYQKTDADGVLTTVQLTEYADDPIVATVAGFYGKDIYQIPPNSLETGGGDAA